MQAAPAAAAAAAAAAAGRQRAGNAPARWVPPPGTRGMRDTARPVPQDSAAVWWPALADTAYAWRAFLAMWVCTVCTMSERMGATNTAGRATCGSERRGGRRRRRGGRRAAAAAWRGVGAAPLRRPAGVHAAAGDGRCKAASQLPRAADGAARPRAACRRPPPIAAACGDARPPRAGDGFPGIRPGRWGAPGGRGERRGRPRARPPSAAARLQQARRVPRPVDMPGCRRSGRREAP